ncbi:MAG TPA: hypothetical protein VHC42_09355 [Rhizomicrobium sp.]|nr:hypothetical protein [Rhizomicrobium sp.]
MGGGKPRGAGFPLKAAVDRLARVYPQKRPLRDPLAILVWENIGYLIDDERRDALFEELRERIGLTAPRLANPSMPALTDIARRGGMHPQTRAERLIEIGKLAISECDGDVLRTLKSLPLAKARALLKKFPSVGNPGADRILLFCDVAASPAVESNGLRALVRMGYCEEEKNYARSYRRAVAALSAASSDAAWLKRAYATLRAHGKALCKRSAPICEPCPLDQVCAHRIVSSL